MLPPVTSANDEDAVRVMAPAKSEFDRPSAVHQRMFATSAEPSSSYESELLEMTSTGPAGTEVGAGAAIGVRCPYTGTSGSAMIIGFPVCRLSIRLLPPAILLLQLLAV